MTITKQITLDVLRPNNIPAISAKQFDEDSRFLKIYLVNGGEELSVESDSAVLINVLRADGESNSYSGSVNEDGSVTVPLSNWLLSVEGMASASVSIIQDGVRLTSLSFDISVQVCETSAEPSEDEKDVWAQALSDIAELKAENFALQSELQAQLQTVDDLSDTVFYTEEKTLDWVLGLVNVTNFNTSNKDKVLRPITLYQGETIKVKTKGDGAYMFNCISKVPSLDIPIASGYSGGTRIQRITSNSLTEYTHTAEEDEFITVCVLNDVTSTVTFENLKLSSRVEKNSSDIEDIKALNGVVLRNKTVMFFGDSLTSASTSGLNGFAKIIAENNQMPYYSFIYDSADGNATDTPFTDKRFVNYAKDGTTNRIISGRTDSVVERVKRHITANSEVDYVLIECCVNDAAPALENKGAISAGYTGFDDTTTIGSIEETIRYLTTLENPPRVGFYIPWNVVWVNPTFFDDYIAIFTKWGVPYFDMRYACGFNMRSCSAHRPIYSLSSDNYSAYDNTATYNLDDKVKYGGVCYKCLANGVVGIPPTDNTKWQMVSSETSDGTHLNSVGHKVVSGKIQNFVESL